MRASILLLTVCILTNCKQVEHADLIIKNAKIYSVDNEFHVFESMVVKDGRILAIGMESEIQERFASEIILDLDGKPVYPGFIDPHCHFYGYGTTLQQVDLVGTESFEEILLRVKKFSDTIPHGQWILGRGWDQNDWDEPVFPDNSILNELFPDNPVYLTRIDGHAALVNQKALDIAGVDIQTTIEGGNILRKNGTLTGILVDNAMTLIDKHIPRGRGGNIKKSLIDAQEKCFEVGLTSVHDAGLDYKVLETIDDLNKNGSLKMRIYAMLSPTRENIEGYMEKGVYKTPYLHISSLKLYADGALGSRGARLIEPYSDDPDNYGLFVSPVAWLKEMCELADSLGYQVCTHCIGDGANRKMLNIYSSILEKDNDKRWRIEHAQIIHPDDFQIFKEYKIIPSVQTTHATSDMYWADERLGGRLKNAYAYKRLMEQNGWIPNGSDFPVEHINPLFGFFAGTARKDHEGYPENGFMKDQALNREQALRAMTIWAAKAGFEENEKGSLEKGKYADFVVLDRDIMEVPEMEILQSRVLRTFLNGEEVYKNSKE